MIQIKNEPQGFYHWIDTDLLTDAPRIGDRAHSVFLRNVIREMSGCLEEFRDVRLESADLFDHNYQEDGNPVLTTILPFYRIVLSKPLSAKHRTHIRVYLPIRWNGRFIGLAGTASHTDAHWKQSLGTSILTWPIAVNNGFACASTDGGLGDVENFSWGFLGDGSPDRAQLDSWCHKATHEMTVIGKTLVQILYGEKPCRSYMHGNSGGGRQAIEEVCRYPEDYDGVWADAPALDYNHLNFSALWAAIVINNESHKVPVEKFRTVYDWLMGRYSDNGEYFNRLRHTWIPKKEAICGLVTPAGNITEADYRVMRKIWEGPVCADGTSMGPGFGPEIIQWTYAGQSYGYLQFDENGNPVLMAPAEQAMRWYVGDPEWDYKTCTYEEFEKIFRKAEAEFAEYACWNPDIRPFTDRGGKLLLTHGTGDPVISFRTSVDYYREALEFYEDEKDMNQHFRFFLQPGAGHSTLGWAGPNVCNAMGMSALMQWVEEDKAPQILLTVKYDLFSDQILGQFASQCFNMWMA